MVFFLLLFLRKGGREKKEMPRVTLWPFCPPQRPLTFVAFYLCYLESKECVAA